MSDTFNYSLIKNQEGAYVVQSTVKSFNLDMVTDKDVVSFYNVFSGQASFDTGLLPLDGTGVLAIRSAGPHTQVVTQHKPGHYHINWGAHEGDRNAKTYYVAQPYRIVIGDFKDGNLLGARMFYSPYPITSPDNILYHVNLPNINCKGYRGNGVGWICLYHKDDWSQLPFNEKVSRFIERCSGVETYNDANMSETDGPRFYKANGAPEFIWNPEEWQNKSFIEGHEWTLDPTLWNRVLVKDMDHQDKHYDDGQPLTLAMAMLGNYQAYYTDTDIPKMYNKVSRADLALENADIANMFKRSFSIAPSVYTHRPIDDPYTLSKIHREQNGSATFEQPTLFSHNEDEDNTWMCTCCEEYFSYDEAEEHSTDDSTSVCSNCLDEHYVYIESAMKYYYNEHSDLYYVANLQEYLHSDHDTVSRCQSCEEFFGTKGTSSLSIINFHKVMRPLQDQDEYVCTDCFEDYCDSLELSHDECASCKNPVITSTGYEHMYPTYKVVDPSFVDNTPVVKTMILCEDCKDRHYVCACGLMKDVSTQKTPCTPTDCNTIIDTVSIDPALKLTVNNCCSTCLGPVQINFESNEDPKAYFKPIDEKYVELVVKEKVYLKQYGVNYQHIDSENIPF